MEKSSDGERSWQVEHRYRAVLELRDGASVREVAQRFGVSVQSVYNWRDRYADAGLAGLQDRSRRPHNSPQRMAAEVEALVCQLRRSHPRWGARRLVFELGQHGIDPVPVASTVHRALVRNGLVAPHQQQHRRKYRRWQREAPMHLWQLDLVGGIYLADGRECKILTGIDDHSRYVVIAAILVIPNGRAVCDAFTAAMRAHGVPSEVLTDNGKQFTGRFTKPRPAEVMFERICRENGITARLTKPRSPTTTGKIERFHQTLRRELLDLCGPFVDLPAAQAALDAWVHGYNHLRPHQGIGMATPASLFRPSGSGPISAPIAAPDPTADASRSVDLPEGPTSVTATEARLAVISSAPISATTTDGDRSVAVTFDHRVPPSGAFAITPNAQQVWLGPAWGGRVVTVWADQRSIHLLADGHLIKTIPSRLTPQQLQRTLMRGARIAGPAPAAAALPRVNGRLALPKNQAVEVERSVQRDGVVRIVNQTYHVSPALVGARIALRLDGHLMHAITGGQLVGSWPCPLRVDDLTELPGARPAEGPLPQLAEPSGTRVQRRVPADGVTMVARQRLRVGRTHAGKIVTVVVEDTHFRVLHGEEELSLHPRDRDRRPVRITAYNRQNP